MSNFFDFPHKFLLKLNEFLLLVKVVLLFTQLLTQSRWLLLFGSLLDIGWNRSVKWFLYSYMLSKILKIVVNALVMLTFISLMLTSLIFLFEVLFVVISQIDSLFSCRLLIFRYCRLGSIYALRFTELIRNRLT